MGLTKIEVTRAKGIGQQRLPVVVAVGTSPPISLEPGETKGAFADPNKGTVNVIATQDGTTLAATVVSLAPSTIIELRIQPAGTGLLARLSGSKVGEIVETGRDLMESAKRSLRHQMWFGRADSPEVFYDFVGERDAYYSDENLDAEGTPDHIALSAFAESQGQSWYDHDFMECAVP